MKFAITGSSGLLGSSFVQHIKRLHIPFEIINWKSFLEKSPLEISDHFKKHKITHLIHCAANTNISDCELNPNSCFASNSLIPQIISTSCSQANVFLCFISSTGIYDGSLDGTPSTELTPLNPLNNYHQSKVYAESYVQSLTNNFLIARVGWLFGDNIMSKKNFIYGRLKEAITSKSKIIYSDPFQLGNPTNVDECVHAIIHLLFNGYSGIFNVVNNRSVTRFEYIQEIYELANLDVELRPIQNGRFSTSYNVSVNESAVNQNLDLLGLSLMPDFRDSLSRSVCSIMSSFI